MRVSDPGEDQFEECSCQGRTKNCERCNGSGMVPKGTPQPEQQEFVDPPASLKEKTRPPQPPISSDEALLLQVANRRIELEERAAVTIRRYKQRYKPGRHPEVLVEDWMKEPRVLRSLAEAVAVAMYLVFAMRASQPPSILENAEDDDEFISVLRDLLRHVTRHRALLVGRQSWSIGGPVIRGASKGVGDFIDACFDAEQRDDFVWMWRRTFTQIREAEDAEMRRRLGVGRTRG